MTLTLPPGALATPTSISITQTPGAFQVGPFGVVLAVELGPSGQTFAVPVTATFRWNDGDSDGIVDGVGVPEANLSVWRDGVQITGACSAAAHDVTQGQCTTACCDRALNTWTLRLTSFSEYVVQDATPAVPGLSGRGVALLAAGLMAFALGCKARRRLRRRDA